jgi:hypothetical protein
LSLLLEPQYWRKRLAEVEFARCGLLLMPRPDLCSARADVVEWRMRTHDGLRIWGLRGSSHFHPVAADAAIRCVEATELPEVACDTIADGWIDFVYQVPAGRRLEDRVLDALRVRQVALHSGVDREHVHFVSSAPGRTPDEFLIAEELVRLGLC